jgi:hypothetical protein
MSATKSAPLGCHAALVGVLNCADAPAPSAKPADKPKARSSFKPKTKAAWKPRGRDINDDKAAAEAAPKRPSLKIIPGGKR